MYHNFIHLSVNGRLGCFHVLAIVNNVAMNKGRHGSFSILVFSGYLPKSEVFGSYGGLSPSFLKNLHTVFHSDCINLHSHPPAVQVCSIFSTPSRAFIVCRLFDDGHPDQCEVVSHCGFGLQISNTERY